MNQIGKSLLIEPRWNIGQMLYFRADREGIGHVLVGYEVRPKEPIKYLVSYMSTNLVAYEEELTDIEPTMELEKDED